MVEVVPLRPAGSAARIVLHFLSASRARFEEEERTLRKVTGRAFIKPAMQALSEERFDHALRLVAAGVVLAKDPDFHLVPELLWRDNLGENGAAIRMRSGGRRPS